MLEVKDLTTDQKKVLLILGKLGISEHKNVRKETIKKKLPRKYHQNFNDTLESLIRMGLIRQYRKENYALNPEGRILAQKIKEQYFNEMYNGLRILLILD